MQKQVYLIAAVLIAVSTSYADEIAFLADRVYYTNANGADPGPFKRGRDTGEPIDLSPDGNYLLHVAYVYKSWGDEHAIYAKNRQDGKNNLVSRNGSSFSGRIPKELEYASRLYSPRWSPDGKWILYARDNELITRPFTKEYYYAGKTFPIVSVSEVVEYCDWAPDGRFVASTRNHEIWITDGSSSQLLGKGFNPDVSPDGTKIAFLVHGEGGEKNIWTMNLDGSDRQLIHSYIQSLSTRGAYIAWSPDSSEIAFFTFEGIWATSLDGIERSVLLIDGAGISSISWSPSWGADTETGVSPASWGEVKH